MAMTSLLLLTLFSACILVPAGSQVCHSISDCFVSNQCCSYGVCQDCDTVYCYSDSDCGLYQQCCPGGNCQDNSDACDLAPAVIVGIVISVVAFVCIVVSIFACCFCACCPLYRRRTGVVLVHGQPRYGATVTTTTTTAGMYPPPGQPYGPHPGQYQPYPAPYASAAPQPGAYQTGPPPYNPEPVKQ